MRKLYHFLISHLPATALLTVMLVLSFVLFIVFVNGVIISTTKAQIFNLDDVASPKGTILVLGSLVHNDGRLSPILQDRVDTALDVYRKQAGNRFLLSGDHGKPHYDEVNNMRRYLIQEGVPEEDIFLDHAGFETYDSVYRARSIFQSSSLVIVTQEYHLPRALYIANGLGIPAVGIIADRRVLKEMPKFLFREIFARIKSYIKVKLNSTSNIGGEGIPITGDSKASWDQH